MYIRFVVVIYLLSPPILGEEKVTGAAPTVHPEKESKVSNSTLKVSVHEDLNNGSPTAGKFNITSLVPAKPKPIDTSLSRSDEKIKANGTSDETWRRSKVESMNFGALLRGFYVFLGLSVIVIMYFTVRAIRLGRKKTKVKKYGILASQEDLEMTPLGVDEEEEDTTIFDISSHPGH